MNSAPEHPTACPYCNGSGEIVGFGRRVRAARQARGWSQSAVAAAAQCSRRTIQHTESGKHMPRPETRRAIEGVLGL